jgi:predicted alpha/beta-hydrolase family hydrolase
MVVMRALAAILLLMSLAAGAAAATPDYARESRWAAEVVPQIVVGDPVWLATPHRDRVLAIHATPPGQAKGAVIVVHGSGVHPDWGLIGQLRSALADRGFATLSVQMPVLAADADSSEYAALYPLAAERLDAAAAWLRERGQVHLAVVSHSIGSAMVNAWLAQPKHATVDAWVAIGLPRRFASSLRVPVLDVHGERDFDDVIELAQERARRLPHDDCSATVTLSGTDHFLNGAVPRAVERIAPFLDAVFAGRC